jgi:hypothetical protein
MLIHLHDADRSKFPNLALMKLSAHHKGIGDDVAWHQPLLRADRIYSSKVFTWTPADNQLFGDAVQKGGTGYRATGNLPDAIEHTCPDYSLYGVQQSYGFLTRGCIRACPWCIVPQKEGKIRAHADIEEFARHREVILMDNNVLAHPHGIEQIEKIARLGLKADFNQGLDARLIDDAMARRLSKVNWLHPLRLACDSAGQMESIQKAVTLLRWHNCTPRRYFVYTLVKDIPDALERVRFLKGLDLDPFAQPYRDFTTNADPLPEQRAFARWVNMKATYKTTTWEEYQDVRKTA